MQPKTTSQCTLVCRIRHGAEHDQSHRGWILPRRSVSTTLLAMFPFHTIVSGAIGLCVKSNTAVCCLQNRHGAVIDTVRTARPASPRNSVAIDLSHTHDASSANLDFLREQTDNLTSDRRQEWNTDNSGKSRSVHLFVAKNIVQQYFTFPDLTV